MTVDEYIDVIESCTDVALLRREAIERMRVNVGLLAENTALRERVRVLEEGHAG